MTTDDDKCTQNIHNSSSRVERGNVSTIQNAVTEFSDKAHANKFQMNEAKCKELRISISFTRTNPQFDPVMVNDKPLEIVQHAKLLGLNISSDLKWNFHVSETTKKAAPRFYFLRQLKRAAIPTKELLKFYTTCIRPTLNMHAQFITTRYPSTYQTTLKGCRREL